MTGSPEPSPQSESSETVDIGTPDPTPLRHHVRRNLITDFVLGSQDGLVNILGIVLGISAATSNIQLLYVASFAALAAESISMAAVAYTSTMTRQNLFLSKARIEKEKVKEIPRIERSEVFDILRSWGYSPSESEELVGKITMNPRAWVEFIMAHEVTLSPVDRFAPRRSFFIVGISTLFGSLVPIIPFFFSGGNLRYGLIGSVIFSGSVLFTIGVYTARITVGSLWKSGLRMMAIGLTAGLLGFLIGYALSAEGI